MRVTVCSSYFPPAFLAGGPVQSLGAMVETAPESTEVDVVTTNRDHGSPQALAVVADTWTTQGRASVWYAQSRPRTILTALRAAAGRRPDILYVNSVFDARLSLLPQLLARSGVFGRAVVVVAPRGELHQGALAIRGRKKRAFLAAYRALGLERRVIWHASTELEAMDIRAVMGSRSTVIVRRNDTMLPSTAQRRSARRPGACRLVFASRLSRKKRLDLLLAALADVPGEWHLRIVGAFDEPEYERRCRELASRAGLDDRVTFVGSMPHDAVLREFADADVFAFPSAGENFGHVIAEALSTGCAVISSTNTPWTDVVAAGGGAAVKGDQPNAYATVIADIVAGGSARWVAASALASAAFDAWAASGREPHLFAMLGDVLHQDR